jgi:hypothetical protein
MSMHTFQVNEEPTLDFELCKHNSPPCKAFIQLWQFDKSCILSNGQVTDIIFTFSAFYSKNAHYLSIWLKVTSHDERAF